MGRARIFHYSRLQVTAVSRWNYLLYNMNKLTPCLPPGKLYTTHEPPLPPLPSLLSALCSLLSALCSLLSALCSLRLARKINAPVQCHLQRAQKSPRSHVPHVSQVHPLLIHVNYVWSSACIHLKRRCCICVCCVCCCRSSNTCEQSAFHLELARPALIHFDGSQ